MTTAHNLQNNPLVWVDNNIDVHDEETQDQLKKLRSIVDNIRLFTEIDECIQFSEEVKNERVSIITSGLLGEHLVPQIHHLPQVDAIYIFCGDPKRHLPWTHQWSKIKGV